jgi:hypothetical protein
MLPDLGGLVRELAEARIAYIVIGGIAVAAHAFVRATEDLDIVPDPTPANLDELCNMLVRIDARLLQDPDRGIDSAIRSDLYRGRNLTVTTSVADLDIIQRLPGVPSYAELESDSWEAELGGARFRVCSRAHLIAMKRARGAAIDLADLEHLVSD